MTAPLPLEVAQARLLDAAAPLGAETIRIEDASGRYLAEPLIAERAQPSADLSAMDGFAVAGPAPWRIVGESAAGHPFCAPLHSGEAIRISTGAVMPSGSARVLIREDAQIAGDALTETTAGAATDRHIRPAGFDFAAGKLLLAEGTLIGPAQLALAIMAGRSDVAVGRRPSLAVIDTGDELRAPGSATATGETPASNGPMIAAMCAGFVDRVTRIGPVPDDRVALHAALHEAECADVIVTTGGASVGDHDLVRPALEHWGATIDFWRVAIRPGKPLLAGRRGAQWIIGLPGNPASAYVTALLFVLPLLRKLGGSSDPLQQAIAALLDGELPAGGSRREFWRGRWTGSGVTPIDERDSSALRALATANLLIDRPVGCAASRPGDIVSVILSNA